MVNETVLYDSRPLEINAEIDGSINYASWQNSVPLLKSLTVSNPTTDAIENVILEAKASPKFLRPKPLQCGTRHVTPMPWEMFKRKRRAK